MMRNQFFPLMFNVMNITSELFGWWAKRLEAKNNITFLIIIFCFQEKCTAG